MTLISTIEKLGNFTELAEMHNNLMFRVHVYFIHGTSKSLI